MFVVGIKLDKNKIEKNPGRRQIAKLKANSQWGYLAMNTNKCQSRFVFNKSEWFELLDNKKYKIHKVLFQDSEDEKVPKHVFVTFSINEEFHIGGLKTNVAVASFVTANARLKLYNVLDKLGERLLYCDTGNFFFILFCFVKLSNKKKKIVNYNR